MTTVVSRLYDSKDTADKVADTLRGSGFPDSTISVITSADTDAMKSAGLDEDAASAYASAMSDNNALFVCKAPFTPFGAARRAIEVADSESSIDVDLPSQNVLVDQVQTYSLGSSSSVLSNHPLMLTSSSYVGSGWSGFKLSQRLGFKTVSHRRKRSSSVIHGGKLFTDGMLSTISRKPRSSSVISGGRLMTAGALPMLKEHGDNNSVMKDHPRITENMGFKTISRR